jgi:serine/threonine protein kinase
VADEVPPASGDFTAGAQLAGYRLAEHIGWGGMAVVCRAYDVRLERWVALKILAPEIARDSSFRQRFIFESRAAAAVDHPHIIPVFEAGESDGVLFIAMRYVGGGDVRTLVRQVGPLDPARVASIIAQVASALDAAHAAGLVHRDVKPANMLLGAGSADSASPDHVYLSDFGLSRQALSTTGPMLAGQVAGTLNYMAPEQIESRPVDGRADLYGLACTAFEMLAGEPPFQRAEDLGLMWAQLAEPPPPLTSFRPDLPSAVDQAMARAMAWSPDDRYQTCLDFAASLLAESGLERAASAQLLTGPASVAARQAAPWAAAGPAANGDRVGMHAADHAVEQQWSPAPLPTPDLAAIPALRMPDYSRPATAERGLPGLGPDVPQPEGAWPDEEWHDEPWPDEPWQAGASPEGPYSPGPRGRSPGRSLVITAAAFVVFLAVAGAAFLALHGGAPSRSRHAAPALPSVRISPGDSTRPGSLADPGRTASPSRAAARPASPSRAAVSPSAPSSPASPSSPAGPSSPAKPSSPGKPRKPASSARPAATVSAYVAAINSHDYARAWKLGGRNSSPSYSAFVQGFGTTAKDTLTILSVSGNVVTARLTALQTDGSTKTYQGKYTVDNGAITKAEVDRIS